MRTIPRAAAVAALVLGCGDDAQHAEVVHIEPAPAPASRGLLRVESERPLTFGSLLSLDSVTMIGVDQSSSDIWLIDGSSVTVQLRRVLTGDEWARAKIVGVAAAGDEWRIVDRAGTIYRFDSASWRFLGQAHFAQAGAVIAARDDGRGAFALLVRQRAAGRPGVEHVLLFVDAAGAAREAWRSGQGATPAEDILSLSRTSDGWLIAGSKPARVLHFDRAGQLRHEAPIVLTPGRRLTRELQADFERLAAQAGVGGAVQPPEYFPAITALRRVGSGYLAVPYVGGSAGEAQGLDWYCGYRYAGTLLDSPRTIQVLLTEHGVMVISETDELAYELEYYRFSDLPLTCEDAA